MEITLNPNSLDSYRTFLRINGLPTYSFTGRTASFPDEYASRITENHIPSVVFDADVFHPLSFDYQRGITKIALHKKKYCIFADCGLGKTLMILDYARNVSARLPVNQCILIVSPLMVINQTIAEAVQFYGDEFVIEKIRSNDVNTWLADPTRSRIGITNYEAFTNPIKPGRLGCLILDESSMLKSHYGKWATEILRVGAGLDYKLACTGTPAPNDRIEYANHAIFMDAFPTVNSFLARFFVNRGQTAERWEMKPHAIEPFYRQLSHWCIFLTNPATYGWKDNSAPLPPIHVHQHHVQMTDEQQGLAFVQTGKLFLDTLGGIGSRSVLSQIAKGNHRGKSIETLKPKYIRDLVATFGDESTIIWCKYNDEQKLLKEVMPHAASVDGQTPQYRREEIIKEFKAGYRKVVISKPKILGFGLNLQKCTRMVFSGLEDSYESYYQAVKRANRYGAPGALNVHIPMTEIEAPMIENVLRKAANVQRDTEEQEAIFRKSMVLEI